MSECSKLAIRDKEEKYLFVLNYSNEKVVIDLRNEVYDLFNDKNVLISLN
ncbi:Beta-galactosidase C-terminal domain [Anaerocolumna jejuensis]